MIDPAIIVDEIYKLLISLPNDRFMDEKPTTSMSNDYIVINSKGINSNTPQKCWINVNCHAKDLAPGIPNRIKLKSQSASVRLLLEEKKHVTSQFTMLIDYDGAEQLPDNNGTHFINLKYLVKIF